MLSEQLDESFLVGEGWLFLSSICQVTLDPNMLAFPTTIPPLHFLILETAETGARAGSPKGSLA